jgi:hypothetical protein
MFLRRLQISYSTGLVQRVDGRWQNTEYQPMPINQMDSGSGRGWVSRHHATVWICLVLGLMNFEDLFLDSLEMFH